MFRTIKILLRKDELNPSTLFNPFLRSRLSMWRVFFRNLKYELIFRAWYRNEQAELIKVYSYVKELEQRIEKMENDFSSQVKWTRL
jgi:hypothetical protein